MKLLAIVAASLAFALAGCNHGQNAGSGSSSAYKSPSSASGGTSSPSTPGSAASGSSSSPSGSSMSKSPRSTTK